LVIATARTNHYRVVPRKDNKIAFWDKVFELRNNGNLSSMTLKSFKFKTKTFYDAITNNNFDFEIDIIETNPEEIQIFTEIN
jgi:hypothetical protein